MSRVYSTYEAKAKLSEIIRKVRGGQRVLIAYRGEAVAEVAPVKPAKSNLADRFKRLEAEGVLGPPGKPSERFPHFGKRRGALARFLDSRE